MDVYPIVAAKQQNVAMNRDRYWQANATHSTPPAHVSARNNDAIPNLLDSGPTDETERWSNVFPNWATDPIPVSLRIDTYDGPSGKGWAIIAQFSFNGRLFEMAVNTGPESERSYEWTEIFQGP